MKIYGYSFKNIGPFSNVPTVVAFDEKAQLNMMIGKNGIGKSTTIKVLKFGLFHELAYSGDIKADEIANDINKNGEIVIELNSRGKDWTIITNFSPNKIRVYEGIKDERAAEPLDKGGVAETKKFIRDSILDIPFYIFDNILSIDVSEFKSLLTLNADDTRKIRDRIFGFSVFNEMSAGIKKKMNGFVEDRKLLEHDLEGLNEQYDKLEADIEAMNQQIKSGLKIDDLKNKLVKAKTERDDVAQEYKSATEILAHGTNDQKYYQNIKTNEEAARLTKEKEAVGILIKENIAKQADIDKQLQELQEYSEVAALSKSVTEDKNSFNEQNNRLKQIIADYNAQSEELKTVNANLAIVDSHIGKKFHEAKHTEYKELKIRLAELDDWTKKNSGRAREITDENITLRTSAASMQSELKARKAGVCHECNTHFDKSHDIEHEKHIAELEKKISEAEAKYDNNQSEANKLLAETMIKVKETNQASARVDTLKMDLISFGDPDGPMDWSTNYTGADATADQTKLVARVTEIKASANKLKDDSTMLRGRLTTLRDQVTKSSEKLKVLEAKFAVKPTGNIDALKELRTSLVTKRNEHHKQENSYDVQIQILNTKIHSNVQEPKFDEKETEVTMSTIPKKTEELKAKLEIAKQNVFEAEKSLEIANSVANLNLQATQLKKQAKEVKDNITETNKKLGDLKVSIERQEHLIEVIKRSKDEVLRVNIPYINHMVVSTCKRIGVTQNLTFDDSFVPHIFRGNREVSLMSASLGQRKKMNFAVLISITKFLKLRYGGLNIIFYDEMFSSIDEEGRPHMLEIIRQEIVENLGIHVWLTNHFFIPNSQFDNYIMVESKNGFSHSRKIDAGELLSLDKYTEKTTA